MIKILLIAVFVVACNANYSRCPNEVPLDFNVRSKTPAITDYEVETMMGMHDASTVKRSVDVRVDTGADVARSYLSEASGPILVHDEPKDIPCPALLTTTKEAQEMCPSYEKLLTSFYSLNGNGFCYVLYPYWNPIYQTTCSCRDCRNRCPWQLFEKPDVTLRFGNYCKPKSKEYQYVWSVCIGHEIRFVQEKIAKYSGGCECQIFKVDC